VRFHIRRSAYTAVTQRHNPCALEFRMARALWAKWSANWFGARRADSGGAGGGCQSGSPQEWTRQTRCPSTCTEWWGGVSGDLGTSSYRPQQSARGGDPSERGGHAAGHSWSPHRGGEPGQLFRGGECREDCAGRPARRRPAPRRLAHVGQLKCTLPICPDTGCHAGAQRA
jgi:hypothetical protein